MDYLLLLIGVTSGIHAITYSRWLLKNGNRSGAIGVYIVAVGGILLPLYRIVTAQ